MKYEKDYYVGIRDIGINNQMTNYAFLSFMEEIASTHSETVGYGVSGIEIKRKVWILMDWKLQVFERPKYGDKIKLKTWARPIEKNLFYTYRDFEVWKGEHRVGIATSKWVLFDIDKNKIIRLTSDILDLYNTEKTHVFEENEIVKIKEPDEQVLKLEYKVKRADIDINQHMHNLNYLKLSYEILPEEVYYREEKKNVRIMYKHQILLGNNVKCYYSKHEQKEIITIKDCESKNIHAIIELY